MHPPFLAKGRRGLKKMTLGARFQRLTGPYYQERAEFSDQQGRAKLSEGAKLLRATMLFCKHVISVATLLLIIHITMYILISLIQQNPWHKTIMALFNHTTIKPCFGRRAYIKCCMIAGEWCRVLLDYLFDISLLIAPFIFVWYKAIRICRGFIWESERHLKPLKPTFSLGKPK